MLDYRNTLFESSDGLDIKDKINADKCRYSEELIQTLYTTEPQKNQSFKNYMQECVKKAEASLTQDELANSKGVLNTTKIVWSEGGKRALEEGSKKVEMSSHRKEAAQMKELLDLEEELEKAAANLPSEENIPPKLSVPEEANQPKREVIIGRHHRKSNQDEESALMEKFLNMDKELTKAQKSFDQPKIMGHHHRQPNVGKGFTEKEQSLKEAQTNASKSDNFWKQGKSKISEMKHRLHEMVLSGRRKEQVEEKEQAPERPSPKPK